MSELHASALNEISALKREKDWSTNESQIRSSALNRQLSNMQADLQRKADDVKIAEKKLRSANEEIEQLQAAANKTISSLRGDNASVLAAMSGDK